MNSSDEIQAIAYQENLVKAAKLSLLVSRTTKALNPLLEFESQQAMIDASIPDALATTPYFNSKFNQYLTRGINAY